MANVERPEVEVTRNDDVVVTELQRWHANREKASRRNRNLLQYAAGIAALLGIGAGSGGIFALATAVTTRQAAQSFVDQLLIFIITASLALAGLLLILLVGAFVGRFTAEAAADRHLENLIRHKPDHFWPKLE